MTHHALFAPLESLCVLAENTIRVSGERQEVLHSLSSYIVDRKLANEPARLSFICTHNSRRSFFAQVWMGVAAARYGLDHVMVYSGGTEVTQFNPRVAASLERSGFEVVADAHNPENTNPHYAIRFGPYDAIKGFSKKYDDPHNPLSHFCAVMVCSNADEACPFIPGAELRLSLPFVDPKASDGSELESATYDARSLEIAAHMLLAARIAAKKLR